MKKTFFLMGIVMLFCMAGCKDDPYTPGGSSTGSNPPAYATFYYQADGLTVNFTANVPSDVYSCEWSFGDGKTGYGENVSHTYTSAGTYYVNMTATNKGGTKTYSESITVKKKEPHSVFITSLTLNEFPAKNGSAAWDLWDDPDVYFKIMAQSGSTCYFTSPTKLNITNNSLPVTYSVNYTLSNINSTYKFSFYDEDDFGDDENMFNALWTPATDNDDYSTYFHWVNYSSDIDFSLALTWYTAKGEELYTKSADFVDGKCLSDDPEVLQALGLNK
ncbi:MAG: PKD domain-containing protein [Bacteroidales bacterium]|nr:PKD domain-containing protein [Bacteroidales bacterium]